MPTERQLANLRPPIRRGEVLNPQGRNQWSNRAEFRALVRLLNEGPREAVDPVLEKIAQLVVAGVMDGDRRLVLELARYLLR
jgi:hypothetical protein